jgi:hypothetical protein
MGAQSPSFVAKTSFEDARLQVVVVGGVGVYIIICSDHDLGEFDELGSKDELVFWTRALFLLLDWSACSFEERHWLVSWVRDGR